MKVTTTSDQCRVLYAGRRFDQMHVIAPRSTRAKSLLSATCDLCGAALDVDAKSFSPKSTTTWGAGATCTHCCPSSTI